MWNEIEYQRDILFDITKMCGVLGSSWLQYTAHQVFHLQKVIVWYNIYVYNDRNDDNDQKNTIRNKKNKHFDHIAEFLGNGC